MAVCDCGGVNIEVDDSVGVFEHEVIRRVSCQPTRSLAKWNRAHTDSQPV